MNQRTEHPSPAPVAASRREKLDIIRRGLCPLSQRRRLLLDPDPEVAAYAIDTIAPTPEEYGLIVDGDRKSTRLEALLSMTIPAVRRDIPDRVLARYLEYRDPDTVSVILPTLKAMGRMDLVDDTVLDRWLSGLWLADILHLLAQNAVTLDDDRLNRLYDETPMSAAEPLTWHPYIERLTRRQVDDMILHGVSCTRLGVAYRGKDLLLRQVRALEHDPEPRVALAMRDRLLEFADGGEPGLLHSPDSSGARALRRRFGGWTLRG